MSTTDHLAKAKEYIAKGDDYHRKAAEEIIAAQQEDPTLSHAAIAERVGKSKSWVGQIVRSVTSGQRLSDDFEVEWGREKPTTTTRKVLADPDQRKQVIAALPSEQIEEVIQEAHGVVMDRLHAKQAERDTTPKAPTAGDLMGGEQFDPSESWADEHIIRAREKAHSLRRHVEKWGLVLGSMDEEQAFGYLQEAERNIAEVRAALQERMADRSRAEA